MGDQEVWNLSSSEGLQMQLPSVFHASLAFGSALFAQLPTFPRPGDDPMGVVVDADAKPVAGAMVALMAETDLDAPFARAIGALLQRVPLPEVPSGVDGSFVLPLTAAQRVLGAGGAGRFWLVVRRPGHRDWREPLPQGIAGYLGSRVVLRPVTGDDPVAEVPWPPSPAALGTFGSVAMWWPTSAPQPGLHVDRRGPRAADEASDETPSERVSARAHVLRVVDPEQRPVGAASLLFGNSCHGRGRGIAFPDAVGADGQVRTLLPDGVHEVRIAAPGFLATKLTVAIGDDKPVQTTCTLARGEVVDLVAVDAEDRAVPFVRLDLVPYDFGSGTDPSLRVLADSLGRARVPVSRRAAYFAYEDRGAPASRVGLEGRDAARVHKRRPVTTLLRGVADLGPRGMVRWVREPAELFRAYDNPPTTADAVARFVHREDVETWSGGMRGVPIVVRRAELPPAPADPLLDLVVVDRRLRERARLVLRSSRGDRIAVVSIGPRWQMDVPPRDDQERIELARRDDDGNWSLWARDGAAYDLVARASGHLPAGVALPAAEPGAAPVELVVELERKRE